MNGWRRLAAHHVESRLSHLLYVYKHLKYGSITCKRWHLWNQNNYEFQLYVLPGRRRLDGKFCCIGFACSSVARWRVPPLPDSGEFLRTKNKNGICTSSRTQGIHSTVTMWTLAKAWKLYVKTKSMYGFQNESWIMNLLSVQKDCNDNGYGRRYGYY